MEIIILGSGGNVPTPRIGCSCSVCDLARNKFEPYKRCLASIFIKDINAVIDCPEDISESINRRDIKQIDNLFITHWHPDHTLGFRLLIQAYYDFIFDKPHKKINVYIPHQVYADIVKMFPSINYFLKEKEMANLILIDHGDTIKIHNVLVTAIGYDGEKSSHFAYLFEESGKKIMYAPCDTKELKGKYEDLDLLIHEQGYFSPEIKWEISFDELLKRINDWKPKKVILTHISEDELRRWGWDEIEKRELQAKRFKLKFAYDGLRIVI